jgi:nucleotide-binding universal stress UspA family protein
MLERLLIASDITLSAYAVVNSLAALRKYGAQHCLLVACLNFYQYPSVSESNIQSIYQKNLDRQQAILEKEGYTVKTRFVQGIPEEVINQLAVDEDYSAIVVGSFARSWAGDAIMGGRAYDIIHSARKPVLIIRLVEDPEEGISCAGAADPAAGCDFGRHVLFPTDFSTNADQAFAYVRKLVKDGVQRVTLLHVQDQFRIDPYLMDRLDEFNQIDEARMLQMKEALQDLGDAEVDCQVLYGSPSAEILKFIGDNQVPLVVMGSQGRGFTQEIFLGSVSHNIARRSTASVLLIPAIRV